MDMDSKNKVDNKSQGKVYKYYSAFVRVYLSSYSSYIHAVSLSSAGTLQYVNKGIT